MGTLLVAAALGSASVVRSPSAEPVTASTPFLFLNNKGFNDIGMCTALLIAIGDGSVVPNGSAGTTGTAETTNLSTGTPVTIAVPFEGLTTAPNAFGMDIGYNVNLLGPWTLTFTNSAGGSTNTASVTTSSLVGATVAPPPLNVTLSSTNPTNPTFSWAFPSNSVNDVIINIYDNSRLSAGGGTDIVYTTSFPGAAGSFTVPTALAGGLTLPKRSLSPSQVRSRYW